MFYPYQNKFSLRRTSAVLYTLAMVFLTLISFSTAAAEKSPVYIGLDAEFGHQTSTSAEAIKRGMEIAIEEINQAGGVLGGRPLTLEIRDNRSVPARGVANIKDLAAMTDLVAVFCGKFSPVVQEAIPTVHELKIPLLDPWAAADNIVDNGNSPNYVFRLSLRDSTALETIMKYARKRQLKRIGLLLPNTGWGRSSKAAAEKYTSAHRDVSIVKEEWYNWGDTEFKQKYNAMVRANVQVIVLVANEKEGAIIVKEIASHSGKQLLPVLSHWGVTGGEFTKLAGDALQKIDFAVVQTYSFIGDDSPTAKQVLEKLKSNYGIKSAREIESPVGLAHAYDLVHLLAIAINKAGNTDREAIRNALENISSFRGLVGNQQPPFTATRHEALPDEQPFMARYADDGAIERISIPR